MGLKSNDGFNGSVINVSTIEPGEVSAQDIKEGKAARVKLRSGNIRTLGGELLRMAIENGGTLVDPPVARQDVDATMPVRFI